MKGDLTEQRLPRPNEAVWRGYVEEWDRSLRAANKPLTTRYNYELAVTQLAEFLAGDELAGFLDSSGLVLDDASDAAEDPADVARGHVEVFLAWMIETRSASTALNKYKALQQFFNYLEDEEEISRHPMRRMPQPKKTKKLIPVVPDDELAALLATCDGKSFRDRRDTAIIRLLLDTGGTVDRDRHARRGRREPASGFDQGAWQGGQGTGDSVRGEDRPGADPVPAGAGQAPER
jgi:integrase/recombinase XerC